MVTLRRIMPALLLCAGCGASSRDDPNDGAGANGPSGGSASNGASSSSGTTEQQGTPATLGDPSSKLFNGLWTVLDRSVHTPDRATLPFVAGMPDALAPAHLPYLPDVRIVAHRDSVVFYVPNVAGAADYRAYVVGSGVDFTTGDHGPQPRGAVVACAGFRQHTYQSEVKDDHHTRELLQALELPGLLEPGPHTVIVEAVTSPCPFVGMPSHEDAQISIGNDGTTNDFHLADPGTYHYSGIHIAALRSFEGIAQSYGNEIVNGQGASIDYPSRETEPIVGATVPPGDPDFPSDPEVIARSAFTIELPAPEDASPPSFDVGPHSLTEDFETPLAADPASMLQNPDYGTPTNDFNGFSLNPMFQMGTWEFWGRFMQAPDAQPGTQSDDFWTPQALVGIQAFTRHGRLYTTFGDAGEDVGGTISFASLVAPVVEMDQEKYIHSVFRINSEASHRRYWYWALCGGASSDEIFDSTAKEYKVRPLVFETTFGPGGNNPSLPDGHTLASGDTSDDAVGVAKECLTITEEGRPEDPFRTDGSPQSSAVIRAQIHPANKSHGIIALGNEESDTVVLNGQPSLGFRFRTDASGRRTGPMIDPYDQLQPLVQYDIFVRSDRLVVFINGEEGFCADLSDVPLSMKAAMIGYGDLIYHSSVEWQEVSSSAANQDAQLYQLLMNAPIASSRVWDTIAHSDRVEIPAQLGSFDPTTCRKPSDLSVQGF